MTATPPGPRQTTRRAFLRQGATAAAAAAFPTIVPSTIFGATAPSKRINVAIIGTGNQGLLDLQSFIKHEDARIVAVCDVNRASYGYKTPDQFRGREPARQFVDKFYGQATRSGNYRGCDAYADFREVLARPDVDAVVVVVPDHWHAVIAVLAARAGKDVYGEKPMSLCVPQGRAMVNAIRKHRRVFQCGAGLRSVTANRHVCELVRNGYIGELKRITATVPVNNAQCPPGAWKPDKPPEGFDYNMWLGPAPWAPYHRDRCFYRFRFILEYAGGQTTNFGAHSLDLAMWGAGLDGQGPVEIEDLGGVFPTDGLFTAPLKVHFRARFENGVELICRNDRLDHETTFEGTKGTLSCGNKIGANPASLLSAEIKPGEIHLTRSNNHAGNFLDCIRLRRDTVSPVEAGHSSANLCHLGNLAMLLKRKLRWDWRREQFVDDDEANRMLVRPMRAPWNVI
jgi:predicted dehydrogenase